MHSNLKKDIETLIKTLKDSKKEYLAREIEKNWHKTTLVYSKELNSWNPEKTMEPELFEAFDMELQRLEFDIVSRKKILSSIKRRRILQTAPHLVVTEGPRMLFINWLGSLGVPENDFYVVDAFSGNPFSNITHPGRIQTKNEELNLIPSRMQDALVYRSKIAKELPEKLESLPDKLKNFLSPAIPDNSYAKWAIQNCQRINKKVLGKNNIVYVDINEVVAQYLVKILEKTSHILYKVFFHTETRKQFMKTFPNETMFYVPVLKGKYAKMENMVFSGESLKSKNREILLNNPKNLINEIKNEQLCPSLLLVFIVLCFFNRFKCFGSFAQVEYLPAYQKKLAKLEFLHKFKIETMPTSNLTFGIFPDDSTIFPAD